MSEQPADGLLIGAGLQMRGPGAVHTRWEIVRNGIAAETPIVAYGAQTLHIMFVRVPLRSISFNIAFNPQSCPCVLSYFF
eukprot:15459742-Alexandrium_andersonii.AAC.1